MHATISVVHIHTLLVAVAHGTCESWVAQVTYTGATESGGVHYSSFCTQNGGPPSSTQTARTCADHQHIELQVWRASPFPLIVQHRVRGKGLV